MIYRSRPRRQRRRRQRERDRRNRVAAFAIYSGDDPVEVPARKWRYHTRYPLADEPEVLARLDLRPEDCRAADLYWFTGDDMVFVEIWLADSPMFGARWSDSDPPRLYLRAAVYAPLLTRAVVAGTLDELDRRCPKLRLDQRWIWRPRA